MVHAYHVIFGAYGFWLPNDSRGSWSQFVGAWELFRYGAATKTQTRASVAGIAHDIEARRTAKDALKYKPVVFTGRQALCIARGFGARSRSSGYRIWACAILPEHVHLVVARHRLSIEQMIGRLKAAASRQLAAGGLHPFDGRHTPWAAKCWKCFLNNTTDIRRAVRYVQDNPLKEGKCSQRWRFVQAYED